jgi:hypothetical protein
MSWRLLQSRGGLGADGHPNAAPTLARRRELNMQPTAPSAPGPLPRMAWPKNDGLDTELATFGWSSVRQTHDCGTQTPGAERRAFPKKSGRRFERFLRQACSMHRGARSTPSSVFTPIASADSRRDSRRSRAAIVNRTLANTRATPVVLHRRLSIRSRRTGPAHTPTPMAARASWPPSRGSATVLLRNRVG